MKSAFRKQHVPYNKTKKIKKMLPRQPIGNNIHEYISIIYLGNYGKKMYFNREKRRCFLFFFKSHQPKVYFLFLEEQLHGTSISLKYKYKTKNKIIGKKQKKEEKRDFATFVCFRLQHFDLSG